MQVVIYKNAHLLAQLKLKAKNHREKKQIIISTIPKCQGMAFLRRSHFKPVTYRVRNSKGRCCIWRQIRHTSLHAGAIQPDARCVMVLIPRFIIFLSRSSHWHFVFATMSVVISELMTFSFNQWRQVCVLGAPLSKFSQKTKNVAQE